MAFFDVQNLVISFGGLTALQDISFEIKRGEIYAIIGPNGAGKTTLFNCINGIYKPDEGAIRFKDHPINGLKPDHVARLGIARTFQNIELFSHMNTMENIMLGRHLHMQTGLFRGICLWGKRSFAGKEEIAHRRKVEEIIDFLDLQTTLALEPELLLLDEPCAGMNAEEKQDMIFWVKDIQDELGVTILLIEHDMTMVMDISDRILAINFGCMITEGTPEEVQKHPEVLKAYLGED
jgi:branched-chain amino acid transport system ATP-binding protein